MKRKPLKHPWSLIGEVEFDRLFSRLVAKGFTTENMRSRYRRADIGPRPMEMIRDMTKGRKGRITVDALLRLKRGK